MNKLLRSMRVFTATVDLGSMKAAADILNMSASAVSQQIHKMEENAGVALLHRNTRNLKLTDVGQQVYQNCCQMIALAKQTEDIVNSYKQAPSGVLKIAAPAGFGAKMLGEPLRRLQQNYPQMRLDLHLQDAELDLVREGIDLAIQIGPLKDSSMVAHHLARWRKLLCVTPNYAAEHGGLPQHPNQLQQWQRIGHSPSKSAFSTLRHRRQQQVCELPCSQLDVNNMQALICFVEQGLGYGALPEPDVLEPLQQGQLVQLLPEWQLPECNAYALTPHKALAPKVQVALNILKEWFARYQYLHAA